MNRELTIGKFILDSLTTGMYNDSNMVYREYVQNSVDSIDQAIKNKILANRKSGEIKILIDKENKNVYIEDNGTGVSCNRAYNVLCDIGNSEKRYGENRGFRGIGRLGGLSYCDYLVFETSFKGENKKTIINWNAKKLKELIMPGKNDGLDLRMVLDSVIDTKVEDEDNDKHYFKVNLLGINNELKLLDENEIKNYLQQVAPIPFDAQKFPFYSDSAEGIKTKMEELNVELEEYRICINNNPSYLEKPYKLNFQANGNPDEVKKIRFFQERDLEGSLLYWGWYAITNFSGTIDDEKLRGIRMRKGNILIGNCRSFEQFFVKSNTRYNGWLMGEIHFYGNKLIPNARRDDFEANEEYLYVKELVGKYAKENFNSNIRINSEINASIKNIEKDSRKIEENEKKLSSNLIDKDNKEKLSIENEKLKKQIEVKKNKLSRLREKVKEQGIDRDENIDTVMEELINTGKFSGNLNVNIETTSTKITELDDNQQYTPNNKDNKDFDIYGLLSKVLSGYSRSERKLVMKIINVIENEVKKKNEFDMLAKKIINELNTGKKKNK